MPLECPELPIKQNGIQWDPKYRIKVRVICARAYHALFMVRQVSLLRYAIYG